MTKEEAFDVLDAIQEFYPSVKMGERKIRAFIPQLLRMDYEGVMHNLSAHVGSNQYAPTLTEIAAYPVEPNMHLEEMRAWQEKAAKVPEETKRAFEEALRKLVEKCHAD
ncbi:hypothetical protein CWR48_14865 [Oceanobacillus arenosus]|uniref:Replicative helicase inhibitor G39P N-terminal domain-containing protein n=1 Tax=Oceanobacillus arenosus TaxID=1229153 RepID=A0A3D8PLT9_9BACI|nr:hypothetical protein [Oceanobacillus arenosus]RDW17096.1 hypothetical protein CWR48_14865 [Oceanobacillus arenosus]